MTPCGRGTFDSMGCYVNKLGRHVLKHVHFIYLSSTSQGDFLNFYYIHIKKINDPCGRANFKPMVFIWTNLVDIE
jgi:hypothetical protein